ncbi:MAG: hypothetical protein JST38_15270, partial [Bacteroidetes bacterium]|nr:hypothetical protein [Bacteroidota bacterium]
NLADFAQLVGPFFLVAGAAILAWRTKSSLCIAAFFGSLCFVAGHIAVLANLEFSLVTLRAPVPGGDTNPVYFFFRLYGQPIGLLLFAAPFTIWVLRCIRT